MPERNLKQATLIPSARAIPNPRGTAPGWWVEHGSQVIIALPGPPRELHPMWRDHALPRLKQRGLGLDRAAETLRLTGIGESMVVDVVGADLLEGGNPRMATYARPDFVDLRVSAVSDGSHSAQEMVESAIAALSPRIDRYVFGRNDDDWGVALATRLGARRLATYEIGTSGYLGLLLGANRFLAHAEQEAATERGALALAQQIRASSDTDIGLAVIAHESDEDMQVEIGLDIEGVTHEVTRTAFRGGDQGRRRSANAAAAELWRQLAD